MSELLRWYIKLVLKEAHLARVPQQLLPQSDSESGEEDNGESECVEEISGTGAVGGYAGPLGAKPDDLERQKNASKRKKKR